jgi:hypothetical protein
LGTADVNSPDNSLTLSTVSDRVNSFSENPYLGAICSIGWSTQDALPGASTAFISRLFRFRSTLLNGAGSRQASVCPAVSGPVGKGLSVLNKGIERQLALVEMGQTAVTENDKDERKFGTFTFVQGQHDTVKAEMWEGSSEGERFCEFFFDRLYG